MAARAVGGQQWAGNFECGDCGRKRLPAAEFSKKQLQRGLTRLRCKQCVESAQEKERQAAQAKAAAIAVDGEAAAAEKLKCIACKGELPAANFSRSQRTKPAAQRRCVAYVEAAEQKEKDAVQARSEEKLKEVIKPQTNSSRHALPP